MQKKILSLFLVTLSLGVLLIVLSQQIEQPARTPHSDKTAPTSSSSQLSPLPVKPGRQAIIFGASISKTGRYHVEGYNLFQGYDLWREHVNNNGGIRIGDKSYRVEIKYYDDQSDVEKLKENMTKLIVEDQVDFILGPFSSGFNLIASEITEKYGKIMIESGGASDTIFTRNQNFTFATQTSASWWFKDFFDMISQQSPPPRSYALLTPDKLFTRSVAKGAQIWAAARGIEEVYFAVLDKEVENFLPSLLKMVEKQPDIIILTSHYQDAVKFSTQLAAVKELQPKAVVMTIGPSEVAYVDDVKSAAEGMIGVTQWVADSFYQGPVFGTPADYVKLFEKKYGEPPTYQDAQSSATGVIYQLALENSSRLDAREVLTYLQSMDVETFYGRVKHDKHGMNIGHKMALVQIQKGQMETIWPPKAATNQVRYPL